ncbi:MAG: aspartate aminotransferase family protein [Tistlia sp.]|uniref:aspartate aminotransferase family protein n=1 Tax=Tistlia sp. TaxID=3057121 RepID=UPI0034A33D85
MQRKLERSRAHFRQAAKRLPLGVASNFRYWGDDDTFYIERAEGGRLWDIDGNAYIDYRLGYGPTILGYCDPRVDAAAMEGMRQGSVFALSTERELAVAERICKMVPAAEMVRFSCSGTEAVMAALRVARAFSGKDGYVVAEGGYHGVFDAALWTTDMEGWSGQGDPELVAYSEGVPGILRSLVWQVPLNDADRLEDLFKRKADKIGALLIEPIQGNCCAISADPAYMKAVRELCTRYGVVLIVDEVKTGFRVARGGAQEIYGIQADLCTYAKAMGNGYPISALAGRRDIMSIIGQTVVHGGTFTAHAVSLAAAEKTLEILDETDALATIAGYGERLREGLAGVLEARGIPHCFVGHPALSGLFFSETPPAGYRDWKTSDHVFYDTLAPLLVDRGVLIEPDSREPWFMCEAHAKGGCLEETLKAFAAAVDATLEQLGDRGQSAAE